MRSGTKTLLVLTIAIITLIGYGASARAQLYNCSICESYGSHIPSMISNTAHTVTVCVTGAGLTQMTVIPNGTSCPCTIVIGYTKQICVINGVTYTNIKITSVRFSCPDLLAGGVEAPTDVMSRVVYNAMTGITDVYNMGLVNGQKVTIHYPSCGFIQQSMTSSGYYYVVPCDTDGRCCALELEMKIQDCRYVWLVVGGASDMLPCNPQNVIKMPGEGDVLGPCQSTCGVAP